MKKIILTRIALFVSLITLLTSTVNTTFGFIVAKTNSLVNIFTPLQGIVSSLDITKSLEHPFGEGYIIPDDISFDFEVNLGSLYKETTIKTSKGDIKADENGKIIVPVKPKETVGIEGIDEGTLVTVTELQKPSSGFSVKDGQSSKEAEISVSNIARTEFVNIYNPKSLSGSVLSLKGEKILSGRDWQEGDSFSFLLERKVGEAWERVGTKTISYSSENSEFNRFDFDDILKAIEFKEIGTYLFRISEVSGNLENIDYDKTINYFSIRVSDADMDGKLEAEDVTAAQNAVVNKENDSYNIFVTFNNSFVSPEISETTTEALITVNKTIENTGKDLISPKGFEFILENKANGNKTSLKTDENGKAVFILPLTLADIGQKFSYTLYEVNDGKENITYDETVYELDITAELNEDGKLISKITSGSVTSDDLVFEFQNKYNSDGEDSPPTGVDTHIYLWLLMLVLSGISSIILLTMEHKYRKSVKH
ncbi:MAG: hypothetical protein J6K88_02990 [Oscillospiraceae bacterium]|nr:hypothetical protein [Oscillospiraceae bacterium]